MFWPPFLSTISLPEFLSSYLQRFWRVVSCCFCFVVADLSYANILHMILHNFILLITSSSNLWYGSLSIPILGPSSTTTNNSTNDQNKHRYNSNTSKLTQLTPPSFYIPLASFKNYICVSLLCLTYILHIDKFAYLKNVLESK